MKRFTKYTILSFSSVLCLAQLALLANPVKVNAVTASDWDASRIIDDALFFNPNSMSPEDIQAFLNAKLPSCDTNGQLSHTYRYNSSTGRVNFTGNQYEPADPWTTTTRAIYGQRYDSWHGVDNARAPYTCLKSYSQNIPGISADNYCPGGISAGIKSAATIIKEVSVACNISPQVILITLQKEQSLITDDWPWKVQYTKATGMGCPDTSLGVDVDANQNGCYDEYEGFFKQIYYGARQFQRYVKEPHLFNYAKDRNSYIAYQANAPGCGGTYITPQSHATAALYNYTPYQPNAAALNNLYGTGDACSAYGNRNFWRMWNDWFGTTRGPSFSAQFRAQSSNPTIRAGETTTVYMQFINTGNAFWKDDASVFSGYNPVHLATTNPINRSTTFRSNSWLSPSRPNGNFTKVLEADGWNLATDQHTVHPGQIAEFQFVISVPHDHPGGVFREYFQPILENSSSWSLGSWSYIDVGVHKPTYKAQYRSQSAYPIISPGFTHDAFIEFTNAGDEPWYDDTSVPVNRFPVHLATTWPINRSSKFSNNWPRPARPNLNFSKVFEQDGVTLSANQHVVNPGQVARFEFQLKNHENTSEGFHPEYFQPILEGAPGYMWNMEASAWLNVGIPSPSTKAAYISQSASPTVSPGGAPASIFFNLKNIGNTLWQDDTSLSSGRYPVHLATSWPINRISNFAYSWPHPARPVANFSAVYENDGVTLSANQHTVYPGQIAKFEFQIQAKANTPNGYYKEYFEPIQEGAPGYSWNMNLGVWMGITVQ